MVHYLLSRVQQIKGCSSIKHLLEDVLILCRCIQPNVPSASRKALQRIDAPQ